MIDWKSSTILITGGTGSFGKKCTEFILRNYTPKKLIIFSRDELKQFEMARDFPTATYPCLRYFIGDIRDKERLYRAFHDVDYVIHAAALKQIPIAEYNPFEVVKTNILGSQNVINVAIDQGVKKVIALSTDKAANPINLYGATKLCADKLFVAGNYYSGSEGTNFSVVRYGNVLGSRGSVVPFFLKKRASGVLPVTDPNMTRFWITLEQAVEFVIKRLEGMNGYEVFVPKIPSMKMVELARAIGPECAIKIVGIRPGEKLHEVMVPEDEARNTLEYAEHYAILPSFHDWDREAYRLKYGGQVCLEGFCYRSDTNTQWLSTKDFQEILSTL